MGSLFFWFLKANLRYALTSLSVFLILSRRSAGTAISNVFATPSPFLASRVSLCASPQHSILTFRNRWRLDHEAHSGHQLIRGSTRRRLGLHKVSERVQNGRITDVVRLLLKTKPPSPVSHWTIPSSCCWSASPEVTGSEVAAVLPPRVLLRPEGAPQVIAKRFPACTDGGNYLHLFLLLSPKLCVTQSFNPDVTRTRRRWRRRRQVCHLHNDLRLPEPPIRPIRLVHFSPVGLLRHDVLAGVRLLIFSCSSGASGLFQR